MRLWSDTRVKFSYKLWSRDSLIIVDMCALKVNYN